MCGSKFKTFEMVRGQDPDAPLASLIEQASRFSGAGQDGWVYVIQNVDTRRVKIGWSATPVRRFRNIETAIGSRVIPIKVTRGTVEDERALHRRFAKHRVLGEWFAEAVLQEIER